MGEKKAPKTKAAVTQLVKQVINRQSDTKYVSSPLTNSGFTTSLADFTGFNAIIGSVGEIYSLLPPVSQSTLNAGGSSHRIGDSITPKKLEVKLALALPYNQQSVDIFAHVYFMTCKSVKFGGNYTAIPITQFLAAGNGTSAGFDGTWLNSGYAVNSNAFTLLSHKVVRLTKPAGLQNTYTSGGGSNTTDMVYPKDTIKTITKTFTLPETLKYANDADTYPSNSYPFMVMGFTYADPYNSPGTLSNTFLNVQGQSKLWFKDS